MSDILREHRLMPNMLRTLKGDRQLADQIIGEVEDSLWLAEVVDRRVAEALNEAAHEMPNDVRDPRHMADWLRARG